MEALSMDNISEDIFQCGRCKVAFASLAVFLAHKREPCAPLSWSIVDNTATGAAYNPQSVETSCGARFEVPEPYDDRRHYVTPTTSYRDASIRSNDCFTTSAVVDDPVQVTCIQCQKTFKRLTNLSVHLRTHAGEKPFQCPICGRCFSQNTHLQRHMQRHRVWPDGLGNTVPVERNAAPTSYFCYYCSVVLPHYTKFRIHLKSHTSNKEFKCIQGECSQLFKELESLLRHVRAEHPQPTYSCHLCEYSSDNLENVSQHQQRHPQKSHETQRKKKFKCLLCDASFGKLEKLTFHKSTHSHLRTCTRCNKKFSSEKRLRSHLRTHIDIRPFQCTVCGASFRLKKYLTTHMLSHGERVHACPLCNMKFKRKDLLDRHRKMHQPRKKLDCPFKEQLGCSLQFSRSDKMKLHIKSHVKKLTSKAGGNGKVTKSTVEVVIIPVSK